MYEFAYHRPGSVSEAAALAGDHADGKLLAGGQTLLPTMKQRLAGPSDLIDLSRIDDLRGIEVKDGVVTIKALTRHVTVATSAEVRAAIPALAELAETIKASIASFHAQDAYRHPQKGGQLLC